MSDLTYAKKNGNKILNSLPLLPTTEIDLLLGKLPKLIARDGFEVGREDGQLIGCVLGATDGCLLGCTLGCLDGWLLGPHRGCVLGC